MTTNPLPAFFDSEEKVTDKIQCADVYIDGVCPRYSESGGWGALVVHGDEEKEIYGGDSKTDNEIMKVIAIIEALSAFKYRKIHLYADLSRDIRKGIENPPAAGYRKEPWANFRRLWGKQEIRCHSLSDSKNNCGERVNKLANRGYIEQFLRSALPNKVNICISVDGKLKGKDARNWEGLVICRGKCEKIDGRYPDIPLPRAYVAVAVTLLEALKLQDPRDGFFYGGLEKSKHQRLGDILFYTDSEYLCKSASERIEFWSRDDWRRYDSYEEKDVPIPNSDLWMKILELSKKYNIEWIEESKSKIQAMMELYRSKL